MICDESQLHLRIFPDSSEFGQIVKITELLIQSP